MNIVHVSCYFKLQCVSGESNIYISHSNYTDVMLAEWGFWNVIEYHDYDENGNREFGSIGANRGSSMIDRQAFSIVSSPEPS